MLYFASASSYTKISSEHLDAPLPLCKLFDMLENKYPGMKDKVLSSCAVTINLEYVDLDELASEPRDERQSVMIKEGDEVAIIPPVSSG